MKVIRFPASPADYRVPFWPEMGRPSDYRKLCHSMSPGRWRGSLQLWMTTKDRGDVTGVLLQLLMTTKYRDHVSEASATPANPCVNPALKIAALAEYAMARIPMAPLGQ